ncbi:helix-turn-helix transcriptional regulator [Labrys miyagiensis]
MNHTKDKGDAQASREPLLSADDAALYLHVARSTLATWRCVKRGPRFLKLGRGCWYRVSDLDAWISRQERDPEAA